MRLIDADELIKEIENSRNNNPHKDFRVKRNHDIEHVHFIKMVYDQPTAFDKEKVIKEIRNVPHGYYNVDTENEIIGIVEKGGIE